MVDGGDFSPIYVGVDVKNRQLIVMLSRSKERKILKCDLDGAKPTVFFYGDGTGLTPYGISVDFRTG